MVYRRNDTIHYGICFRFVHRNSNNKRLQRNQFTNDRYGKHNSVTTDHYSWRTNNVLFGWFCYINFFYRRLLPVVNRRNYPGNQCIRFRFLYGNNYYQWLFGNKLINNRNCKSCSGNSNDNCRRPYEFLCG